MPAHQLHRRICLASPVDEAFEFFCDPMNLQRITPPELDLVDYELPLRPVGELAHFLVRRQLDRIFNYRESAIQQIFGRS